MFYYYGRKKKVGKYYPSPKFETIIEPFAGSAAYSLHNDNWKKSVILVEKDVQVFNIWDWLINHATQKEVDNLPTLKKGERSSEFLHIIHCASKMAFSYKNITVTEILARNWDVTRRVVQRDLFKVKHWKVIHGDYTDSPNIEATWFIDPPYQGAPGMGYRCSSNQIDYDLLGKWVHTREGEVICCDGPDASYLPFEPLVDLVGIAGKRSKEMLYYKHHSK